MPTHQNPKSLLMSQYTTHILFPKYQIIFDSVNIRVLLKLIEGQFNVITYSPMVRLGMLMTGVVFYKYIYGTQKWHNTVFR